MSPFFTTPGVRRDPVMLEVMTGELRIADAGTALHASALGSCIAVVLCDPARGAGGLAHVMLPGRSTDGRSEAKCRYAEDAIEELVACLEAAGSSRRDLTACVAGGGNVLQRPDDTVCRNNIASVLQTLERLGVPVVARSLGGVLRRRVRFDVSTGCVHCAEGDGPERVLWSTAIPA